MNGPASHPGMVDLLREVVALRALASRLPDDFPLDPESFLSGARYALIWATGGTETPVSETLKASGPLCN